MESRFKVNIPVFAGLLLGVVFLLFYILTFDVPDFEISCLLSALCGVNIFLSGYSRNHSQKYASARICIISFVLTGASMAMGVLFESLFIITAAWAALMGLLLWQTRMLKRQKHAAWFALFLILSFPWFEAEFHFIGVIFRYGGAFLTELLARFIGLNTLRQGTLLSLEGVDISISEACSGMATLQGMIIIGLYLFHDKVGTLKGCIFMVISILILAFITNTLRIVLNSFIILTFGVKIGMGITHDIIGLAVSGCLFYLFARLFSRGFHSPFAVKANQF